MFHLYSATISATALASVESTTKLTTHLMIRCSYPCKNNCCCRSVCTALRVLKSLSLLKKISSSRRKTSSIRKINLAFAWSQLVCFFPSFSQQKHLSCSDSSQIQKCHLSLSMLSEFHPYTTNSWDHMFCQMAHIHKETPCG